MHIKRIHWIYEEILITYKISQQGSYLIIHCEGYISTSYECDSINEASMYYELIKELTGI